jgi:hypothetical protein
MCWCDTYLDKEYLAEDTVDHYKACVSEPFRA